MKKTVVLASSLFVLLFCFSLGAQAMPPQGLPTHGLSGGAAAKTNPGRNLVLTLEYSRHASWLTGFPELKKGQGRDVTVKIPLTEKKYDDLPLAIVNGRPLMVGEFRHALLPAKSDKGKNFTVDGQDPAKVLNRMVNSRVYLAEAHEIGIDQLPDLQKFIVAFKHRVLRWLLLKKAVSGVKANPKAVKGIYRDEIKEAKIKSVLFFKEKDAKDFVAQLKKGADFDKTAKKFVDVQKGVLKGGTKGEFVPRRKMSDELASVIDSLKKGQVSRVVPVRKRYAVVELLGVRYPDNPHAMVKAKKKALDYARNMKVAKYTRMLTHKYVKFDKKLFDSLKFAKNIKKLVKDKRVLATIKGYGPVTIAEVAKALRSRYFHGFDRAVKEGKIAQDKIKVLNEYIGERVYLQAALDQGLKKEKEYSKQVRAYEDRMIFGAYMQKVLAPKVKLTRAEVQDYYKNHKVKYSTPEMLGIQRLVFKDEKDARSALEKLQKGTEINWLAANTPGQVPATEGGLLDFGDGLVAIDSMPSPVREALDGVSVGDARLYNDQQGHVYVLYVKREVPPRVQPFKDVRDDIAKAVYSKKLSQLMEKRAERLRKLYKVRVFVKGFNSTKL